MTIKLVYPSTDELQAYLDDGITYSNNDQPHKGKMCFGRTPVQPHIDRKDAPRDKIPVG
ncbi:hypothetical protein GCM10027321_36530 [Massilia terrae]|uniref:Uncharacterized protein n=1 Tax=Massilia terrae TaxID=1811224 RepID=A0ABT2D3I4_9BURK|nr:hypothetical protein [Massilia terrae]MCS0660767.1 hypothetical protein [Massilia terrae]